MSGATGLGSQPLPPRTASVPAAGHRQGAYLSTLGAGAQAAMGAAWKCIGQTADFFGVPAGLPTRSVPADQAVQRARSAVDAAHQDLAAAFSALERAKLVKEGAAGDVNWTWCKMAVIATCFLSGLAMMSAGAILLVIPAIPVLFFGIYITPSWGDDFLKALSRQWQARGACNALQLQYDACLTRVEQRENELRQAQQVAASVPAAPAFNPQAGLHRPTGPSATQSA